MMAANPDAQETHDHSQRAFSNMPSAFYFPDTFPHLVARPSRGAMAAARRKNVGNHEWPGIHWRKRRKLLRFGWHQIVGLSTLGHMFAPAPCTIPYPLADMPTDLLLDLPLGPCRLGR